MREDKLRDLTPVDVTYAPGDRPTDEKLEGAETQTRDALKYIENTLGDAFGEGLQTDLMYISNISRDIGDRSLLNPIMQPDIFISSYTQDLSLGKMEHELDLIPVGFGSGLISSSADSSIIPSQFKSSVDLLEVVGDWTILPGKTEGGIEKNSRKLVTHTPSSGGTITLTSVTSGRGSGYVKSRNNTIPSAAQARAGGPFPIVTLSDATNNIYTIQLPVEDKVEDNLYSDTNASLSNTKASVGSGQQLKLPRWLFDPAGLDIGTTDPLTSQGKVIPLNTIRIYDWQAKKIVEGLLEVKASGNASNRETEFICTFRSNVILDTVSGQYLIVTSGASISEMIGALQRDLYFHKHIGDDMIRAIKHSDLMDLRTGDAGLDRSKFYGPSNIDNNDHSMYLHRDGFSDLDIGAGGNVLRGHLLVGNTDTGLSGQHENYNLNADSYSVSFGKNADGGKLYFDKVRDQNLPEGRGNIPQAFSDTSLVIEGSKDSTTLIKTAFIDGNLRVSSDVVLGTDATHDVFVSGDIYIKNSMTLIPRTTAGLTPETGMMTYSSTESAPIYWNGSSWINLNSTGYVTVVGDGVISFGKYNGTDAATLQSAITDVVAQGGGKLKILRGTYDYGLTTVTVPSGVSIDGEKSTTDISALGTAFSFDLASAHSSISNLLIRGASIAVSVNGDEHSINRIDFHDVGIAIELESTAINTHISSGIKYTAVTQRIKDLAVSKTNHVAREEAIGFTNRLYLIDPMNKDAELDKWTRTAGASIFAYENVSDSMIGYGRYSITGTGTHMFEDLMPVMPSAGIGGYIGLKDSAGSTVSVGIACYDADQVYLGIRWCLASGLTSLTTNWSYIQDICVQEGVGVQNFIPGTRYIKGVIDVSVNVGVVYLDGFNFFPMNFSTISLYS